MPAEPDGVELVEVAVLDGSKAAQRLGDRAATGRERFPLGQVQRAEDHGSAVPHLRALCPDPAEVLGLERPSGRARSNRPVRGRTRPGPSRTPVARAPR